MQGTRTPMLATALRRAIERDVAAAEGAQWTHVGATGWGAAWSLATGGRRYFVKYATGRYAAMLGCEADGLRALADTRTVRVPAVASVGSAERAAYLALQWLDMRQLHGDGALGRELAHLHRAAAPHGPRGERYGWHRDNWIGGTPQANGWSDDWCAFFRDRRLAPQLALACRNGYRGALERRGECLLTALPALLGQHAPLPSLVHGDLWSGNAALQDDGRPVVFDPAVYVGDREVDLAMSELFGGFGRAFATAYDTVWPVASGYAVRRDLYNLYHLLNHVNLFGAAYLARVEETLARLIAITGQR